MLEEELKTVFTSSKSLEAQAEKVRPCTQYSMLVLLVGDKSKREINQWRNIKNAGVFTIPLSIKMLSDFDRSQRQEITVDTNGNSFS